MAAADLLSILLPYLSLGFAAIVMGLQDRSTLEMGSSLFEEVKTRN